MTPKLPFDYVLRQVDMLYSKEFADNEIVAIDKHIDFIRAFINSCGWDEEDFIRASFEFEPLDENKQSN